MFYSARTLLHFFSLTKFPPTFKLRSHTTKPLQELQMHLFISLHRSHSTVHTEALQ